MLSNMEGEKQCQVLWQSWWCVVQFLAFVGREVCLQYMKNTQNYRRKIREKQIIQIAYLIGVNWGIGRACGHVWITSYNLVYKEILFQNITNKYYRIREIWFQNMRNTRKNISEIRGKLGDGQGACGDVWVTSYRPASPPPTKRIREIWLQNMRNIYHRIREIRGKR